MMNNQQALALRADAPAAFGSRDEIEAIAKRIGVMLPSAHLSDWQSKQANRSELQKRLDESIYRAAQLSVFYRLVPGEDVHVIPFGDSWAVDMGIETWKKAADRYCSLHGITYHIHTEEMSEDELRQRRGSNFDAGDAGMVAYLWRSDKKDVYEIFGAKQSMTRAAGVWAVKAKLVKGEWKPDNIPTQRSKQDVAKRRAMKAVLKLEFSLDSLLAATPAEISRNAGDLAATIDAKERHVTIIQRPAVEVDEDGCIVASPAPPARATDLEFVVVGEQGEADAADVDDLWDSEPEASSLDYAALANRLDGKCATFAQGAKRIHMESNGPATVRQYQYLAGVIDSITGQPDSHGDVLGLLIGREVNSDACPGFELCQKLLDYLVKEKSERDENGTKVKTPNIAYRADYVAHIAAIWDMLKEAQP